MDLMRELWLFLRERKKLWLLPFILVLAGLGALLVFAQGLRSLHSSTRSSEANDSQQVFMPCMLKVLGSCVRGW